MSSGDEEPKTAPAEEKKGGRGRAAKKEAAPKRPAAEATGDDGASAPKKGRGRPKATEAKAKKAAKPKVWLSCLYLVAFCRQKYDCYECSLNTWQGTLVCT